MEKSIEDISKDIADIEGRLAKIANRLDVLYISDKDLYEKAKDDLRDEYFELNHRLDVLYRIENAMSRNPDINGESIDLYAGYRNPITQECWYNIFLTGAKEYVGNIRFSGNNDQSIYGNVSYFIEEGHRGNKYAFLALKLMGEDLYKRGVDILLISAYEWNSASIKTIEKFGGICIGKCETKEGIIRRYKCNLSLIINRNNARK